MQPAQFVARPARHGREQYFDATQQSALALRCAGCRQRDWYDNRDGEKVLAQFEICYLAVARPRRLGAKHQEGEPITRFDESAIMGRTPSLIKFDAQAAIEAYQLPARQPTCRAGVTILRPALARTHPRPIAQT